MWPNYGNILRKTREICLRPLQAPATLLKMLVQGKDIRADKTNSARDGHSEKLVTRSFIETDRPRPGIDPNASKGFHMKHPDRR